MGATLLGPSDNLDMGLASKRKGSQANPMEWVDKQVAQGKTIMSIIASLLFIKMVYGNVNMLTIAAEVVRFVGLGCIVHKIGKDRTCTGEYCACDCASKVNP